MPCISASRPLLLSLAAMAAAGEIEEAISPMLRRLSLKYDCAISLAVRGPQHSDINVALAAGQSDRISGRKARATDRFVWGSVTKLVTGASVLRLVDQGALSLQDRVAPLDDAVRCPPIHHPSTRALTVDPFLARSAATTPSQNFSSIVQLWGEGVGEVRVKDLLSMHSGIPDFDTATPGKNPTDPFRASCYAHPRHAYSPAQLISLPWVRRPLLFPAGTCDVRKYYNCYSSTNYVLLGMLLAQHFGEQKPGRETGRQGRTGDGLVGWWESRKLTEEGCESPTDMNAHYSLVAAGVFGGWTASDLVADASDVAQLGQDVYGPDYKLISKPLVDMMYAESAETGYGLATFNLSRLTPNDIAYGHLGATYGYQSLLVYVPTLQLSFAIGTNIERDFQDQPSDVSGLSRVSCSMVGS
ncbi:MAG: hypothetical protein SGPRY_001200 [Prymnesium sp.]